MLTDINTYDPKLLNELTLESITEQQINQELEHYLNQYQHCFTRSQQTKYFNATIQGLLSNLDRKSAEPIALHFLTPTQVRGQQDFFTRSKDWPQNTKQQYQTQIATQLTHPNGFLSVDESCFPKKGTHSAGVARQYCGRLGKKENCQSGVFLSYASPKGYGLIESQLYLPKHWFNDDHTQKRAQCHIPQTTTFQTKNQIATQLIDQTIANAQLQVKWIGCDTAFGCDHTFLDGLPASVHYFVAVKETEYIYRFAPQVVVPKKPAGRGRPAKHPRALEQPICVQDLAGDDSIVWEQRVLAQGAKGPIVADVKCVRAISCRLVNQLLVPGVAVWVYVRRYEDGTIKYFLCNASEDTSQRVLDWLATMRRSIEQCFLECKSFLGMGHYETRSYDSWHRHMLLVMVAHHFTCVLREVFKKRLFF
jgi:SRSO17 transposase